MLLELVLVLFFAWQVLIAFSEADRHSSICFSRCKRIFRSSTLVAVEESIELMRAWKQRSSEEMILCSSRAACSVAKVSSSSMRSIRDKCAVLNSASDSFSFKETYLAESRMVGWSRALSSAFKQVSRRVMEAFAMPLLFWRLATDIDDDVIHSSNNIEMSDNRNSHIDCRLTKHANSELKLQTPLSYYPARRTNSCRVLTWIMAETCTQIEF